MTFHFSPDVILALGVRRGSVYSNSMSMRFPLFQKLAAAASGALLMLSSCTAAYGQVAQAPVIPNFWDPQERFIKPNLKDVQRMRFLTVTDFPPFSYIDKNKRLVGFHVDLARAICEELEVLAVCQIQALQFAELESAVTGGQGEFILAGMKVTPKSREKLTFSRPYFYLPARFVAQRKTAFSEPLIESLSGREIAIVDGTAQAAYAKAHFGGMNLRLFATSDTALAALEKEEVSAVFDDGLSLSFWLQTQENRAKQNKKPRCCHFVGGPYLSTDYFGRGLSVGMPKGDVEMENAINFALRSINDKGRFAELYLRYFPISLY